MIGQARQFIDRVRAGLQASVDLTHMAEWLVNNTAHPKEQGQPWSFKHHEMQIAIANDPRHHVKVRKCSQVGLSELSVRICLGLLSIYPGHTAIYTLPTANYARKFTKARFDPVIEASQYLKDTVPPGSDSSELKQFGNSFLYIVGTSGQSAPISIPADILVRDEVDFSDQEILTKFFSRLGHAEEGGIIRDFSTPTVDGLGISKGFESTSKSRYMVKHAVCGQRVAPEFLLHVRVPGYEDPIIELDKQDLANPQYDFEAAQLICPECDHEITHANLMDASAREWVEENPQAAIGGYQVVPFDVPAINTVTKTLQAIDNYQSRADWVNFELGLPFQNADNSFVREAVRKHSVLELVHPHALAAMGCVAGLDIGKVSHLIIGRRVLGKLHLIWREEIKQDEDNNLLTTVKRRIAEFGIIKLVVDAGPDFTTATQLIGSQPVDRVFACYYVRSNKTAFSNFDVRDEDQVVNANKVRCFDHIAKLVNSGKVYFPKGTVDYLMMEHLAAMKRISRKNASGDTVTAWVNTRPDHYAHALNYLSLADQLCDYHGKHAVIPTLPRVGRVKFGGANEKPLIARLDR